MRIIHLSWGLNPELDEALRVDGFRVTRVFPGYPWRRALLQGAAQQGSPDAIVASWPPGIGDVSSDSADRLGNLLNPVDDEGGGCLAEWLRRQPKSWTMTDGRLWNTVPFVVILDRVFDRIFHRLDHDPIYLTWRKGGGAKAALEATAQLRDVVEAYWRRVVAELEDIGFLLRYEAGRLVVTTAFNAPADTAHLLYHSGAAPRRGRVLTLRRNSEAARADVEAFEAIINNLEVTEARIHAFLEGHPDFLAERGALQPLSHIRLTSADGRVLVPDFVLRPVVSLWRDLNWKVLDLKKPQVPLLVGPARRRRLSAEIHAAIRQR
jgi:hypothetical protein